MNYKRNKKYFAKQRGGGGRAIGMGVLLAILGIAALGGTKGQMASLGIGMLFVGILVVIIAIKVISSAPTDQEIDEQIAPVFARLKGDALKRLNIEEEQLVRAPILFWAYDLEMKTLIDPDLLPNSISDRKGKDEKWRSPHVALSALLFTEKAACIYRKSVSLISDATEVGDDELYYKHVSGCSTEKGSCEIQDKLEKIRITWDSVVLKASGDRMVLIVPSPAMGDNVAKTVKTLLREKAT